MPTDQVKVAIIERNGGELADYEELDLRAENVYLSSSSFPSYDNVKLALESIVGNPGFVFGSQFYQATDDTETSTTSTTTYSTKLTINAVDLPLGNYLISHSCIHRTAAANRETDIRIMNGGTTLFEVRASLVRTQGRVPTSGIIYRAGISGNQTFTMEFRVGGTATTSYLSYAKMTLWRVS